MQFCLVPSSEHYGGMDGWTRKWQDTLNYIDNIMNYEQNDQITTQMKWRVKCRKVELVKTNLTYFSLNYISLFTFDKGTTLACTSPCWPLPPLKLLSTRHPLKSTTLTYLPLPLKTLNWNWNLFFVSPGRGKLTCRWGWLLLIPLLNYDPSHSRLLK